MFKSIKIKNLRAIEKLNIDNLGQINLFVGQNNCGKTTILEGLFFLIGATNPQLLIRANTFRALNVASKELLCTFFNNMDVAVPIEISCEIRETKEKQKLLIRPKKKKTRTIEHIDSDFVPVEIEAADSRPPFIPDGLELEYSSTKNRSEKTISEIFLKGRDVVTEGYKERELQGIFINPLTLYSWKDRFGAAHRKKLVPELISFLKKIDPHISDLGLNEIGLLEVDIGLPSLLPANLVGGGIVKFLSVALAMLNSRDGIVLIDEVENGLHYSAQQKIWEAIFNWSEELNVQVFATTHSYECINAFATCAPNTLFAKDCKLFRIERTDGVLTPIRFGTPEDILTYVAKRWEIR